MSPGAKGGRATPKPPAADPRAGLGYPRAVVSWRARGAARRQRSRSQGSATSPPTAAKEPAPTLALYLPLLDASPFAARALGLHGFCGNFGPHCLSRRRPQLLGLRIEGRLLLNVFLSWSAPTRPLQLRRRAGPSSGQCRCLGSRQAS